MSPGSRPAATIAIALISGAAALYAQDVPRAKKRVAYDQAYLIYCVALESQEWAESEVSKRYPLNFAATGKQQRLKRERDIARQVFSVSAEAAVLRRFHLRHDRLIRIMQAARREHGDPLDYGPEPAQARGIENPDHFDGRTVRLPDKYAKAFNYTNPSLSADDVDTQRDLAGRDGPGPDRNPPGKKE
jgi:hypothetical protein